MTTDLELETWKQEWRDQTEPLPELKKKIRRQNLRTVAAIIAVCVCLAVSTIAAWRNHSWLVGGFAVGLGVTGLVVGSYAWWVRRGAWKPTAQTTLAYAELLHKRAIAKVRTLKFSFYFLLVAIVLFTALMAWHWEDFHVRDGVVLAALIVELFFIRRFQRRKKQEVEKTKKLVDEMQS